MFVEKTLVRDIRRIQRVIPPSILVHPPPPELAVARLLNVPRAVNALRETANSNGILLVRLSHMRVAQFETCWDLTKLSLQSSSSSASPQQLQLHHSLEDLREQVGDFLFMTSIEDDGTWGRSLPLVLEKTIHQHRHCSSAVYDWNKRFTKTYQRWWGKLPPRQVCGNDGGDAQQFLDAATYHYTIASQALEYDRADVVQNMPLLRRLAVGWWL